MLNRFFTDNWQKYLTLLFALVGIGLFSSGIVSWIAANWHFFSKFEKIYATQGLLIALILLGVFFYWRENRDSQSTRYFKTDGSFFVASVVIGALFALIGQIYQTGADPWQLFALWSALQIPLFIARPNVASALLLCTTLNLTLWLFGASLYFSALLNFGLLVLAEFFQRSWQDSRRILARTLNLLLVLLIFALIYEHFYVEHFSLHILYSWLVVGALFVFYRRIRFDLFCLALYFCYGVITANILIVYNMYNNAGHYAAVAPSLSLLLNLCAFVFGGMQLYKWFKARNPTRNYSLVLELFFLFLAAITTSSFIGLYFILFEPQNEINALLVPTILLFFVALILHFGQKERLLSTILFAMAIFCSFGYYLATEESVTIAELSAFIAFYTAIYALDSRKWLRLLAACMILSSLFLHFAPHNFFLHQAEISAFAHWFGFDSIYWLGLTYLLCRYFQPKIRWDLSPFCWALLLMIVFWGAVQFVIQNGAGEAPALPEISSIRDFIHIISNHLFEAPLNVLTLLGYVLRFSPLILFVVLNRHLQAPNSRVIFSGILLFVLAFIASPILLFFFALLLMAYHRQSQVMFGFSVVMIVAFLANYYYWLEIPLLYKAFLLLVCGLVFLLISAYLQRQNRSTQTTQHITDHTLRKGVPFIAISTLLATLGIANITVQQNENVLANGDSVILALAPIDPRSLMQGDYMALNYEMLEQVENNLATMEKTVENTRRVYALVKLDEHGIAQLCRVTTTPPQQFDSCLSDIYLPIKVDGSGHFSMPTMQYFFEEGKATHFAQAKYGEYRVKEGKALLLRLLDSNKQPL